MIKRLATLLSLLLTLGFTVTACGDDDNDSSSSGTSTPAAETTATDAAASEEEATDDAANSGDVADTPEAKEAIAECKKQVDANSQISDSAKKKIGDVCEKAGSGDAEGAVDASKEACTIIVEDTVPAGAARETALSACDSASATP